MPFRIAKQFTVESGHLLTKHPGACRFPHGHSRTIEVVLAADTLDARDMVCDFKALKRILTATVECFDHSLALNTEDPQFDVFYMHYRERVVPFDGADPTSEMLAQRIFRAVQASLRQQAGLAGVEFPVSEGVRIERVRVTETASSWAEYWE